MRSLKGLFTFARVTVTAKAFYSAADCLQVPSIYSYLNVV